MPQDRGKKNRRTPAKARRKKVARNTGKAATEAAPGVAGAGAAAAAGALSGPAAPVVGPAVSLAISRFLKWKGLDQAFASITDQFAARERKRTERAFQSAMEAIGKRLAAGGQLRNDGFFDQQESDDPRPSDAEEILEGILRAAVESQEYRKADRLGELYGYIAAHSDVSPAHANYLIALARRLTYQQMLLLGLFSKDDKESRDWASTGLLTHREVGLIMALFDLAREGLLVRRDNQHINSFADVNLSQVRTVLNGRILVEAMNLIEAEPEDVAALFRAFDALGTMDADEGMTRAEGVVPPGSPPEVQRIPLGDHQVVRFEEPTIELQDLPPAEE